MERFQRTIVRKGLGNLTEGTGLMGGDEYHHKAQYFLGLARRMSRPEDRAVFLEMAAVWTRRAEQAEQAQPPKKHD